MSNSLATQGLLVLQLLQLQEDAGLCYITAAQPAHAPLVGWRMWQQREREEFQYKLKEVYIGH